MPTKDSTVIAVRIKNETLEVINHRIKKKGITINKWLTWCVNEGLRLHRKRGE